MAQVQFVEVEMGGEAQGGEVALFDFARVVGDKGIQAGDGVAGGDQVFAEMRTDKTGGSGDEKMHGRDVLG